MTNTCVWLPGRFPAKLSGRLSGTRGCPKAGSTWPTLEGRVEVSEEKRLFFDVVPPPSKGDRKERRGGKERKGEEKKEGRGAKRAQHGVQIREE